MKKFKKSIIMALSMTLLGMTACSSESSQSSSKKFETITAKEAKTLMDEQDKYVILDVREKSEYEEGHVPNAILLSLGNIDKEASKKLTHKDQLILVYCRSGNRSNQAAKKLVKLGYTNVKDFGGIIDWPYKTEK
ncbi:MAG: rhodanese-like domain-containing protein [Anaerostipes sp.]|nr:rhodanese-like domain-containing protein [Anaerostipes sp.]